MDWKAPFRQKATLTRVLAMPRGTFRPTAEGITLWPRIIALVEDERQARRPFLWLAPFAILGALLYSAADREPSLIASGAAVLVWSVLAFVFRRTSLIAMQCMVALAAIASGFLCAGLKTQWVAAPILVQSESGKIEAIIESVDPQVQDARLILRLISINGRSENLPLRVRVKGPRGMNAGDQIVANIHLMPPPEEARPGGYNFARDAFFKGVGAVGAITGPVERIQNPVSPPYALQLDCALDRFRNAIAARIIAVIGGQSGAVAAALMTGKRGMISDATNADLRDAGIYHVVSISGLHMVLAAGMIFFVLRLALSLIPRLALYWPVKQIAAAGAMCGAFAYNVFAGSEVATERSLIMTLFLFGAILVGRPAISMRNLAFAALIVVMLEPDSVTGPSFQMSFAAVAALIAVFERRAPVFDNAPQARVGQIVKHDLPPQTWTGRAITSIVRHIRMIFVTTVIAEAATGPYAAFHFQRFQPLGLIGNALSIPLIEMLAMPLGFIGLAAMPFGLDGLFWTAMGLGVDPMLSIAAQVSRLPIANSALPAISVSAALILSFGLMWLTLWSSLLRFLGLVPVTIGIALALYHPKPDIFVARDGQSLALRMADGRLHVMGKGASDFIIAQWLAADGDLRKPDDATIRAGPICNSTGCVARLTDGRIVALSYRDQDLKADCTMATILVTPLETPSDCKAFTIDRRTTNTHGAIALYRHADKVTLVGARDPNAVRPWTQKSDVTETDDITAP